MDVPSDYNKPRHGMCQGKLNKRCYLLDLPRFTVCIQVVAFFKTLMTLGNGYLGSRIDEERSKMRYLV
jgi:hypothetical protein